MRITNPIGKKGEDIAVEYLKKKGHKILERNFRKGYGEIDIIAIQEHTLVFIEVKTRTNNSFGTPLEAITSWKLRPVIRTAQYYASSHPELPQELRIDAIAIILTKDLKVEMIEYKENISDF